MLIIFVPSDEDEVSEDPRPVPRKSKKKYGKVIQHFLILHLDLISWFLVNETFLLAHDWYSVKWPNIPQLKLGHSQGYHPTDRF